MSIAEITTYIDTHGSFGTTIESLCALLQPHVDRIMYVEVFREDAVTAVVNTTAKKSPFSWTFIEMITYRYAILEWMRNSHVRPMRFLCRRIFCPVTSD